VSGLRDHVLTVFRKNWLVIGLCAVVVVVNPFGYRTALDHQGARLFGAYAGLLYGEGARAQTVVVLLQDPDLETFQESWPMKYVAHARVLREIRDQMSPRALMIDFLFIDKGRVDGSLPDLVEELKNYQTHNIPVFLALPLVRNPQSAVLSELRGRVIEGPSTPSPSSHHLTQLVPVPRFVDDEQHNLYPFFFCITTGSGEPCQSSRTAAVALYDQIRGGDTRDDRRLDIGAALHGEEFILVWGRAAPDGRAIEAMGCKFERFGERFLEAMKRFSPSEMLYLDCPSTPTVSVTQLVNPPRSLASRFAKRVVFYGANLEGTQDVVRPPLHQPLAGVYAHAMAFDNLRTYGRDYKRESSPRHDLAVALGSVTVVQFGLLCFGTWLRQRLLARRGSLRIVASAGRYVVTAFGWVVIVGLWEFHVGNHIPGQWLEIFLELVVGTHAAEMVAKFVETRHAKEA
jgi:CHASE2 domain-containing sensor protein